MAAARFNQLETTQIQMPSSWNDYITMVMTDSGYVSKGGIYGMDGRKWASSVGFDVKPENVKAFVHGFTDPSKLWVDGLSLGGKTFTCTRCESGVIVGRESATGTGCLLFRCSRCLLIAVHEEGAHPGGCYNLITKLGEYLTDQGI